MLPTAPATPAFPPLPEALLAELSQLLGSRLSTSASVREHHGRDISALDPMPPQAVAFVNGLDEIVAVQQACHRHRCRSFPTAAAVPWRVGCMHCMAGCASTCRR